MTIALRSISTIFASFAFRKGLFSFSTPLVKILVIWAVKNFIMVVNVHNFVLFHRVKGIVEQICIDFVLWIDFKDILFQGNYLSIHLFYL